MHKENESEVIYEIDLSSLTSSDLKKLEEIVRKLENKSKLKVKQGKRPKESRPK